MRHALLLTDDDDDETQPAERQVVSSDLGQHPAAGKDSASKDAASDRDVSPTNDDWDEEDNAQREVSRAVLTDASLTMGDCVASPIRDEEEGAVGDAAAGKEKDISIRERLKVNHS